jgi:hypothetical protein
VLTIQYLEYSPQLAQLDENEAVQRLRHAYERLPFTHLLIGWYLSTRLLETIRAQADQLGTRFIRWHPLLTGDGVFQPHPELRVVGTTGQAIRGFEDKPEFTFVCPNHPAVQEALLNRVEGLIQQGLYQGFFLDRVRLPSPSADPVRDLGCFCKHCQRKAAVAGLDLQQVQSVIIEHTRHENGRITMVQALLGAKDDCLDEQLNASLQPFLEFRRKTISDFVAMVAAIIKGEQLESGLDCFSPSLTALVGQDLGTLSERVDWIKLMSYAHTFAPAGLPYELSRLCDYLVTTTRLKPAEALSLMSEVLDLPLPTRRDALKKDGLSPAALVREVRRGIKTSKQPVLAGVELVNFEGDSQRRQDQIKADLQALQKVGAAGLALSWDLLYMLMDWLSLVRQVYFRDVSDL